MTLPDQTGEIQVIAEPSSTSLVRSKPEWYRKVTTKDVPDIHKSLHTKLLQTKTCISNCVDAANSGDGKVYKLEECFKQLRLLLHEMHYLDAPGLLEKHWPPTVKSSGILSEKAGLPLIFDTSLSTAVTYPWDIRADAQEIYNKWARGDFDINILRGITIKKIGNRSTDSIHPGAKIPWNYFGAGNLVNGQWWPTQLTAVRDGAHGSAQGGIAGIKGSEPGAVSIVMAGGYKEDRDNGDEVFYTGTEGEDGVPTENTKRLVESAMGYEKDGKHIKNPVRVLRSHKLGNKSAYAPTKGFRYDGLYDVVSYNITDSQRQIHVFRLTRQPGQDPIRALRSGSGSDSIQDPSLSARPTKEEVEAYHKVREVIKDFL